MWPQRIPFPICWDTLTRQPLDHESKYCWLNVFQVALRIKTDTHIIYIYVCMMIIIYPELKKIAIQKANKK